MRRRDTNCHLILIEWPAAPPPAIPAATGQTRHPRQHWPWLRPDGTHRPLTRTRCRTYVHACMHTYTHARVPSSMPRHNRPSPELPGRLSRYTTSTVSNPRDTLPPRHTACTARRARVAPQHVAPAAHGPDYAWPPRHMAPKATAEGSEQQVGEVSKAPTHAASTGHTLCPTVRADPHRGELHPLASQILAEDSCIHRPRRSSQRRAACTVLADPRRSSQRRAASTVPADPRIWRMADRPHVHIRSEGPCSRVTSPRRSFPCPRACVPHRARPSTRSANGAAVPSHHDRPGRRSPDYADDAGKTANQVPV